MVFIDAGHDEPALVLLAYSVRHPPEESHAESVYRRAHRRLHPYPPVQGRRSAGTIA